MIFWSAKVAEDIRKAEKSLAKINEEAHPAALIDEDEDSEDVASIEETKEDINKSIEEVNEEINESIEEVNEKIKEIETIENVNEESSESESNEYDTDSKESYDYSSENDEDSDDDETAPVFGFKVPSTPIKNSPDMIGVNELIEFLESIEVHDPFEPNKVTIGFVGYPNVGKSSTINAILGRKKVSVSATPGHTKRFQTLMVTDKLIFCDCPGLVMPSVVHSKGHLMVSGILPIDTIRDYIAPINIVSISLVL